MLNMEITIPNIVIEMTVISRFELFQFAIILLTTTE